MGAVSASLAALALAPAARARALLVLESPAIFAPGPDGCLPPGPPRLAAWSLKPVLALLPFFLRQAVYNRRFWERGLGLAGGCDAESVMMYRWPSLVQDWDRGLARFVATRLHGAPEEAGLVGRLKVAVAEDGLRVVVVHGEADRIVPVGNSQRLAKALGAELVRLPGVGHTAHEEDAPGFAQAVAGALPAPA